jgi:hypothetical protein
MPASKSTSLSSEQPPTRVIGAETNIVPEGNTAFRPARERLRQEVPGLNSPDAGFPANPGALPFRLPTTPNVIMTA